MGARLTCCLASCLVLLPLVAAAQDKPGATRSVTIIDSAPATGSDVAPPPPPPPAGDVKADNAAGLSLEVIPGREIDMGTPMSFRVTTQKQGYLVLVDVDASGKLTQIYPNAQSLAAPKGKDEGANLLKRGTTRIVPDKAAKATFQFVASDPKGVGMVVAILSDKPVQIIDLPDVPRALAGQPNAVAFVRDNTRELRILPADEKGQIEDPKWSFTTQFYTIR